jgi:hypothetical protein
VLVADAVLVRFRVAHASVSSLSPDIAAFTLRSPALSLKIGPFMNEAG